MCIRDSATAEQLRDVGRESMADDAAARSAAAAQIRGLRDLLCEEGFDFQSFAAITGAQQTPENNRWQALAALEKNYSALVQEHGWRDDTAEKCSSAARPGLPASIKRVLMFFVPDPPPLALKALEHISQSIPVHILVHAPDERRHDFDAWGRPRVDAWSKAELSLDPETVEVCDNTITVAERIRDFITHLDAQQRRNVVAGVADPQTAARLRMTLARDGINTFDPGGVPAAQNALFTLADRLITLPRDATIDAFFALVRHPLALHRLTADIPSKVSLLTLIDDFQNRHMPVTLEDALVLAGRYEPQPDWLKPEEKTGRRRALIALFDTVKMWLMELNVDTLSVALPAVLTRITAGWPVDEDFRRDARIVNEVLERLALLEPLCRDRDEAAEIWRAMVDGQTITTRRHEHDIDLLGWLELAWDDAPMLLLADLNDGLIPGAATSDPFLPDNARSTLGLRDNRHRLARDAYLLEVMIQSRPAGAFRGYLARASHAGDVLKPSRLLFMGPPADLPRRALYFFAEGRTAFVATRRKPFWLLRPPSPGALAGENTFSASKIKTYLRCPFRFYLQHAGGLEHPFERKHELDHFDFGSLVHEIMQAFAVSPVAAEKDSDVIASFLVAELDRILARRFGAHPGLPVVLQRDVIAQRLHYAAKAQAAWRALGWKIDPQLSEKAGAFPLGEYKIKYRIDRIDVHEQRDERCVIDYKTSSEPANPSKTHLKKSKSGAPNGMNFSAAPVADTYWVDVQMPVYAAAARALCPEHRGALHVAHFALPTAVTDTAVLVWKDFDDALITSALTCAREVIARVRAGVFWPPASEFTDREASFHLFFDNIRDHLAPDVLTALERAASSYAGAAR